MRKFPALKMTQSLRSIVVLSAGSLAAQALNFIGSIVIAKQYSDFSIGQFTYFLSIVAMFSTVINGRYDVQIVSAKSDDEVNALVKLSSLVMFVLSAIITGGCLLLSAAGKMASVDNNWQVLFIFPLLIVAGLINVLNSYNNRYSEYKLISGAYLLRTVFQNLIFFAAGFVYPTTTALLTGQLVGQFSGVRKQSQRLKNHFGDIINVPWKKVITAAKDNRDQLAFSVPASFLNAVSYSIISLLVGNCFGMSILALYSYSVRVLGLPLSIFSSNIAKVHFRNATEELNISHSFAKCTRKMILFATALAVAMATFLMLYAPYLFEIIYGQNWRMAGVYVQILTPMFSLRMIVGAIGFTFIIANKQSLELLFQALLLISFFVIYASVKTLDLNMVQFTYLLSITYSLIYLGELISMIAISRKVAE